MQSEDLRALSEKHLVPFFSGAELQAQTSTSTGLDNHVAFTDPCTIKFKVLRSDLYRLVIRRSPPFAKDSSATVTEKQVVSAFVDVVREMETGLAEG